MCLLAGPFPVARAASVPVIGRACVPNAFSPALRCTLLLEAPGDRLTARGLHMFSQPELRPKPNGEFDYLPFGSEDVQFDHVNVFWHAQQHLLRLERLGIDLEEFPVLVRVSPGAASFTHFTEPNSTIGTGLNGLDQGAKDSDIIVHEITHAVFNPRMPLGIYPIDKGEALPTLEGLADYFAAAVNGNTRIGEFARPPAGYHDLATDPAVYHYDRFDVLPADPYSRGKVLNGALLEIRAELGETADKLVVRALDHGPQRCFTCFADAVRWADAEHHGGMNLPTIEAAFARRGIPTGPPVVKGLVVPDWAWLDEDVTARVLHSCGVGPFTTTWRLRDGSGAEVVLPSQGDTAVFRGPSAATYWLEGTLRDARGEDYPVTAKSIRFYDRNTPGHLVEGIRIVGPARLDQGRSSMFTYELLGSAGIPPATAQWSAVNANVTNQGDRSVFVFPTMSPVRLKVRYSDAIGQVAEDSVSLIVVPALRVGPVMGPSSLGEDQSGVYLVQPTGGIPPYRYSWTQITQGGNFLFPDTNQVTSRVVPGSFTMSVTVVDSVGWGSTASLFVRKVIPMAVDPIEGPGLLVSGQPGTYVVRVQGGVTPYRYAWHQQTATATYPLANVNPVVTQPLTGDFTLFVTVTDAVGLALSRHRIVSVSGLLAIGTIEGPASVFEGQGGVFRVQVVGGRPPYRYQWFQHDESGAFALPEVSEVTSRPATRDHWLTVTVRDSLDQARTTSKRVIVLPAPPTAAREFRLLGNVLHRGANAVLELPTPDAPGTLEILDTAGRLRASGRVPAGSPATLTVPLPGDLDSGIYFVRLRRVDRTWTARLVVIAR